MDRDLCGNCGRWREEHYNQLGAWRGEQLQPPCVEYYGVVPSPERRAKKQDQLNAAFAQASQQQEPQY